MKQHKTGLTIMRAQPLHAGHESIIKQMLGECETVIVLMGSAQESRTERNPFTVAERARMIKNIFGDRVLVAGIEDLGNINLWAGYVLAQVWKNWKLAPDAYYCGGEWDGPRFQDAGLTLVNLDRGAIPISATEIRRNPAANLKYINEKNQQIVRQILTKG